MTEECNIEEYELQGSMDEQHWIKLGLVPKGYIQVPELEKYSNFRHFRIVSLLTKQIVAKALNTNV